MLEITLTNAPQDSAKDAYYIVNDLFANQDFETLAPMVSEKLLDAFR
jgi:predicted lipid-binding transport protein (Tim44 family)